MRDAYTDIGQVEVRSVLPNKPPIYIGTCCMFT